MKNFSRFLEEINPQPKVEYNSRLDAYEGEYLGVKFVVAGVKRGQSRTIKSKWWGHRFKDEVGMDFAQSSKKSAIKSAMTRIENHKRMGLK